MVAAAANVWNVPTANLILAQGGVLAEHVSSANTYFNGSEMVFPADVLASNYQNVQIAVIYDQRRQRDRPSAGQRGERSPADACKMERSKASTRSGRRR